MKIKRRSSLVVVSAVTLTLLVAMLTFWLVRSQENGALEARFQIDAKERVQALDHEMQLNIELLQSLVSFYASSERVTRQEFNRFLAGSALRRETVQSLQWAPRVIHAEREQFEEAVRNDGFPGFQIKECDSGGNMIPAGKRSDYFPVTFLTSIESNGAALGFDLLSHPDRQEALLAARDAGKLRASARVSLVQGQEGFLVFAPIYRSNDPPATLAQRRATITGFCVGVFRLRAIIEGVIRSFRGDSMSMDLFDDSASANMRFLASHSNDSGFVSGSTQSMIPVEGTQYRQFISVGDRQWLIVCKPSPAYLAKIERWKSWTVLAGGILLSAFLAFSLLQNRLYADSLEKRVWERTRDLDMAYQELKAESRILSRTERSLRESQQELQAILNNTTSVVYVKDLAGHYLLVNQRYRQLFGVSDSQIIGRTDRDIFPFEVADMVRANDSKVLAAEAPLEIEEVVARDGEPRTYISVKFPLRNDQGAAYAVCGISTDITERKVMEEALKTSKERYDLIINGINDGIWDWNLTTNEVYFSPRWKSMLGYADSELKDNFSSWQELLHPEDAERSMLTVQAYLAGSRPVYELEHRLRHKDGTYRWILARGVASRDAEGRPVRMAGSHVDLTERKRVEEQLRRANRALGDREVELTKAIDDLKRAHEELKSTQLQLIQAEKLESIGKLAAGVAHEVKNPLQTMIMGLTYLEGRLRQPDEDVRLAFRDMRDAIERANSIVRGLLQMSGSPELDMSQQDVNSLIEKALWLVNYSLNSNRIETVQHLETGMPKVWLDHGKMEQVFINLFTNAIHAMPNGGTLFVTTYSKQEDGVHVSPTTDSELTQVIIEIQDTGTGIPTEHLSRLFTPFFTTKKKGLGTGLGLSVTKSIIELHGGRIELNNAPEGGVQVTVALNATKESIYEKSTNTVCG